MVVKDFTPGDHAGLGPLQPQGWNDIADAFRFYVGSPFCHPMKAMAGRDMVGVGAAVVFDGTAWLAHIIVHHEHRNQGIGRAIVDRLMEIVKEKGCGTVSLIATELGRPVYLKAGFADQTDYVFFKREQARPEGPLPPGASVLEASDRPRVLELDRRLSGESRQALFEAKWEGALVHRTGDVIDGYYVPALGEGLLMAENDRAGLALLGAKLARSDKNVLPAENVAGIGYLVEKGFIETKRARRMVWGPAFEWWPENLYSRVAGNVG
jgi:GNAT superfamily N-acetyltransferase